MTNDRSWMTGRPVVLGATVFSAILLGVVGSAPLRAESPRNGIESGNPVPPIVEEIPVEPPPPAPRYPSYVNSRASHPESQCRSGCPDCIRPRAVPSDTGRYWGGYVGGGSLLGGDGGHYDQGTWGWDYEGLALRKLVWLGWTHGRRYQGGTGHYKTDGPKLKH